MRRIRFLKFAALAVVITGLLALSSCNLFKSTFTIYNNASWALDFVKWTDANGTATFFGDDSVWDTTLGSNEWGIASGSWSSREVGKGSDYIYFYRVDLPTHYRTDAIVTISSVADETFTFYDTTVIWTARINGQTRTQTFKIVPVPGDKQSERSD